MIRGIETLAELEGTIRSIRADVTSLDTEKEALFAASQENKRQQLKILERIAQLHFEALTEGKDEAGYTTKDYRIDEVLSQRQDAFERLKRKIGTLSKNIDDKEQARTQTHHALEETLTRLAHVQQKVQTALKNDPRYQEQFEKTANAKEIAQSTAKKAKESIQSYREKMQPFEQDMLFWYLWQRHYGTSQYNSQGLSRLLDGWVATLSNYESNRTTYWTLSHIPERLEKHAEHKEERYQNELKKLIMLEKAESEAQGMKDVKKEVQQKQKIVDGLDADIASLEQDLDEALEEQKHYLQEKDTYARQITKLIESVLSRYGAKNIYEIAKKTAMVQDDTLAMELRTLEQKAQKLQEQMNQNRERYDAQLKALRETEALRRRFKASRYDDIHSGFDNNVGMGTVLGEILGGALSNAGAWERMSRHQRPMNSGWLSDFGSGSFSQADSPWYTPTDSGGFTLPDFGGMTGSDTFRTGGGF